MAFGILSLLCAVKAKVPNLSVPQLLKVAAQREGWDNDDLYWCPEELLERGLESLLED